METKELIFQKLEDFIKKFYTNELLKGIILFTGFGLLYFMVTLLVEHFLWLSPKGRTILFWLFVLVELFFLLRFILFPLFKLFKLQKGIDYKQASLIIGNHFSEVNDKLTNFLQLYGQSDQSELLLASIEQKAISLKPVPFGNAINFKKNTRYLPYAIIPLLVLLFFMVSGNSNLITESLDRVVHYKKEYAPPAPFSFQIMNKNLTAEQGQDFLLQVKTNGTVIPENAMIAIGNENYYLENVRPGVFQYQFDKITRNTDFKLLANEVVSNTYQVNVVAVPTIANFEMVLNFPSYLGKKPELIQGSGNAIVPEGTTITWKVNALATSKVVWKDASVNDAFKRNENLFSLSKRILQNTEYQILTSNEKVTDHEKLQYQITTVKDQFPTISVQSAPDSLKLKKNMVIGQVSDDYGLTKLQVVYYPKEKPNQVSRGTIPVKRETFDQFVYTFPNGLNI
ncbi:MAG: hypothetical protein E2604_13810, partial [Flavobacterium sp.]|nr:hypothetical protein [Flavobacterium sp.]